MYILAQYGEQVGREVKIIVDLSIFDPMVMSQKKGNLQRCNGKVPDLGMQECISSTSHAIKGLVSSSKLS